MRVEIAETLLQCSQPVERRVDPVALRARLAATPDADAEEQALVSAVAALHAGEAKAAASTLAGASGPVADAIRAAAWALDRNWFPGDSAATLTDEDVAAIVEPPGATGDPVTDALVVAHGRVAAMTRTCQSIASGFGRFGRTDRFFTDLLPTVEGLRDRCRDGAGIAARPPHPGRRRPPSSRRIRPGGRTVAGGAAPGDDRRRRHGRGAMPHRARRLARHAGQLARAARLRSGGDRRACAAARRRGRAGALHRGGTRGGRRERIGCRRDRRPRRGPRTGLPATRTHGGTGSPTPRRGGGERRHRLGAPGRGARRPGHDRRRPGARHRGRVGTDRRLGGGPGSRELRPGPGPALPRPGVGLAVRRPVRPGTPALRLASELGAATEPALVARELAELYRQYFPLAAVVLALGDLDRQLVTSARPITDLVAWATLADRAMSVHARGHRPHRRRGDRRRRPPESRCARAGPDHGRRRRRSRPAERTADARPRPVDARGLDRRRRHPRPALRRPHGAARRPGRRGVAAVRRRHRGRRRSRTGRADDPRRPLATAGRPAEALPIVDQLVAEGALAADHAVELYLGLDQPDRAAELAAGQPPAPGWQGVAQRAELAERTGGAAAATALAGDALAAFEAEVLRFGRDALRTRPPTTRRGAALPDGGARRPRRREPGGRRPSVLDLGPVPLTRAHRPGGARRADGGGSPPAPSLASVRVALGGDVRGGRRARRRPDRRRWSAAAHDRRGRARRRRGHARPRRARCARRPPGPRPADRCGGGRLRPTQRRRARPVPRLRQRPRRVGARPGRPPRRSAVGAVGAI